MESNFNEIIRRAENSIEFLEWSAVGYRPEPHKTFMNFTKAQIQVPHFKHQGRTKTLLAIRMGRNIPKRL